MRGEISDIRRRFYARLILEKSALAKVSFLYFGLRNYSLIKDIIKSVFLYKFCLPHSQSLKLGNSDNMPRHEVSESIFAIFPVNFSIIRFKQYRKIPKINPGAYIFQRSFLRGLFWRGLSTEGNLRFKIDSASLIVGRKFTVLLCFTLYLRAISKYKPPRGGLYLEGQFKGGFFALRVWGAYI